MDTIANAVFLPWVRRAAAAAITVDDSLEPSQRGVVELAATLAVNGAAAPPVRIRLRGPADVAGIDPHEIVRMDPRPGSADFEPNYFPLIEFDRPDFPWLFTPARADARGRLRPWLCLVVVRAQAGVTIGSSADSPLPVLDIGAPARPIDELPDLAESWLWAHAQVASGGGATAGELSAALGGDPALSLSRLIAPRLLTPRTDYLACVVPTFEIGRKTGLGIEVPDAEAAGTNGLRPAWVLSPAPAAVRLPVYHHWRFRTSEAGDFESLVRLLTPRPAPAGLGTRLIDVSRPGFALPATFPQGVTLPLGGALRPLDAEEPASWPAATAAAFQAPLAQILNTPGLQQAIDPGADPLLAPPLYGQWHAARRTVTPGATAWLDDLNLDPRHRVVAAFGTRVVQEHQEALMAAAWGQAAEIERANQRLRQLQLGLSIGRSLYARHLSALPEEGVLRVMAPALARLRSGAAGAPATETLVARLGRSQLPVRAASPAMRRIARERGPITRRVLAQGGTRTPARNWLMMLNTTAAVFVASPWYDLANVESIRQHLPVPTSVRAYRDVTETFVAGIGGRPAFQVVAEGQPLVVTVPGRAAQTLDSASAARFRAAAVAHLTRVQPGRVDPAPATLQPLAMDNVRAGVLAQIEPTRAFVALARAVVATTAAATPPAPADAPRVPIETVMVAPAIRRPMYEPLRDLSPDLLLPGLDAVLPNTAIGLVTNRRFVEAYMVGLNVEMGRELLWRGFPTDQRGTCFDRFWDSSGAAAPRPDIRPLHEWGQAALGRSEVPPVVEQFVMLLRSDLLRRYPNAVVYATPARRVNGQRVPSASPADEVYPAFRGSLPPDVSFFGFDLPVDRVIGGSGGGRQGDGYFVVIQEQPTEPRFGLEVGVAAGPAPYLRAGDGPPAGVELNGLQWGGTSAQMAGIVRQQPVRVAMHASQFITRRTGAAPTT